MSNDQVRIVTIEDNQKQDFQPDPSHNGACFLAWLSKRSGVKKLKHCKQKAIRFELNLNEWIREMGRNKIIIARSGGRSGGEKYVKIMDNEWCDYWKDYYDEVIPHHSNTILLNPQKNNGN